MIRRLKNREVLTILRAGIGSYDDLGNYTEPLRTEVPVKGHAQPLSPGQAVYDAALKGRDVKGMMFFHTEEPLLEISTDPPKKADIVRYLGKLYTIITVNAWRNHYESIGELL